MPSKFQNLLKDLNIDDKNTKRIKKQTSWNHVKDNIPLIENANMMCDLLSLPIAKFGFHLLFVIVDLATNKFDIEPMKNKTPEDCLKAMKKCFSRGYVKKPEYSLKTDAGTEFLGIFNKWLYDESILHKTALPHRHQSMGNVENLNRQLGRMFNLYMNQKEKARGKKFVNWVDFVPTVRTELNKIRENELPEDINSHEYPIPQNTKEVIVMEGKKKKIINEVIKPKFKVGQNVYRYLDQSRTALNKAQNTAQRREGDINWDNVPREILDVFTYGGNGPLYRYMLDGLPNVTFTEQQLRRAPAH